MLESLTFEDLEDLPRTGLLLEEGEDYKKDLLLNRILIRCFPYIYRIDFVERRWSNEVEL